MALRNLAIIAHVDHGKTTLVDGLIRQSGILRENQQLAERVMDSGDQERERGITILAKCTSVPWGDDRLNIVDTPGHADFGGEVERILSMVDGVVLLVDAAEGPMPQTKFVVAKALALGLKPIVLINKVDRHDARPTEVQEEVFDLFDALGANDEQLDFPTLYAAARDGWAAENPEGPKDTLTPLFDAICERVPVAVGDADAPFAMLTSLLDYDPFLGRVLTGRIESGTVRTNTIVRALNTDSEIVCEARLTKLLAYRGIERVAVEEASAGDIIAIAGLEQASVPHTICARDVTTAISAMPVDPPTLSMRFSVNDSPLAGTDGNKLTSRELGARLEREAEGNVAINVTQSADRESFEVAGRGELQLGVLIETLRREGFEMSISRPQVIFRTNPDTGAQEEPMEEVQIDVDDPFVGAVVEGMSARKAEMTDMQPSGGGKTRVTFSAPSRGLIGYHGDFLSDTRGTGVMSRLFAGYGPVKGELEGRRNGVLISNIAGKAVAFALWNLEDRGQMFIEPAADVYPGAIIGEHSRPNDLEVNPLKAKQLTNIRQVTKDEAVRLTPPRKMSLEQALSYIADDERVEVTPKNIRLRKALLDSNDRKRAMRTKAKAD